jgi:hypothetical protein
MSVDAKKINSLLHAHSIFRWLDLLNKRAADCLNKRIRFQKGSIVITLESGLDYGEIGSKRRKPSLIVATIDLRELQLRNLA